MLRFKPEVVTQEHRDNFLREVRLLKSLPSVKGGRLIVGSPSLTDPIEWSKGFEFAMISYHENLASLREYQASKEHHRYGPYIQLSISHLFDHPTAGWLTVFASITSTYMFPFDEDLCSFDFEVGAEDEYMC
ncbi:hypothetical protein B0T17DRAFT_544183 [Bombardia bombarda]|uniref:Stress-response A/B barrel domain-containing protein n=1 Tax=Bombardia bombarda TaxID=252184 RepID=A0AA39U671_9PEZI|nr:hypothetical protein B0T17DRAFT_544183 [Bombardia bombarda]